jgi:hypothetical protein
MEIKWDQSRLDRAIQARIALMGRTAAQIANTAAYWIAVNTKAAVPFTTINRIDTDLNVAVDLVKTKRGKRFLRGKKFQVANRSFGAVGNLAKVEKYQAVPLLALIIQARVNPSSRYNQLTGGRYFMTFSPFKGKTRAAGAAAMLAEMRRVLAARHSSVKYLLSGEVPAIRALAPYAVNKYRRGGASPNADNSAYYDFGGPDRGYAIPAFEGFTTWAKIVNATGTIGENQKAQNDALWRYVAPARQQAIDIEATLMESYVEKAMAEGNKRFNVACA